MSIDIDVPSDTYTFVIDWLLELFPFYAQYAEYIVPNYADDDPRTHTHAVLSLLHFKPRRSGNANMQSGFRNELSLHIIAWR